YLYKVFKEAAQVIVVGNGLREAISKYIDKDKILIIPNMVSIERKYQEVDVNKKGFRFFSLGLLNKKKGMDLLIDAFNNHREILSQCELYIGGDGEERASLQRTIEQYGLNDKIKLIGKLCREEVAYHMSNCDCFVLASRFETFGIVYLEAMIYGKPVIATKTGGPDTFVNDENGILVPVNDVNLLGEAIVKMANRINDYDADKISNFCKENFSEEAVCKK
ncbi:glycosyltransferase, partial [Clostridium saudiense]|nr:glycosyltransferase [Clostridium saudiense]